MLSKFIAEHRESMLHSWQSLMQINSFSGANNAGPSSPDGPRLALEEVLRLAASAGLNVTDEGDFGYAEWGEGSERVDVITHVDVTEDLGEPSSSLTPGVIDNGRMIGRGALDAKGPLIAAMFALIGLREEGIEFSRRVRLVFLTDVESTGKSALHYVDECGAPDAGFSTDGTFHPFPACGVGVIRLEYRARTDSMLPSVIHLSVDKGKGASIPTEAIAVVECHSATAAAELDARFTKEARQRQLSATTLKHGTKLQLNIRGTTPVGTVPRQNALSGLILLLAVPNLAHAMMWRFLASQMASFAEPENSASTGVQMIPFLAELVGDTYAFLFHIRYSIDTTLQDVRNALSDSLSHGWSSELLWSCTLPSDSKWAVSLFALSTNDGAVNNPKAAEMIHFTPRVENTVPYGPVFEGDEQTSHQSNESWTIDSFFQCTEAYATALLTLANSE